jgi:hypothetical protein
VIGEGGGSNSGKGIKPVTLLSHFWCWAVRQWLWSNGVKSERDVVSGWWGGEGD